MSASENQIVVYQPNETVRLDVRLENETVWLTQEQIANLFGTKRPAITKHLANIYKSGELEREGTCSILEHMGNDGKQSYRTMFYNLDAILSVGYRIDSHNALSEELASNPVVSDFATTRQPQYPTVAKSAIVELIANCDRSRQWWLNLVIGAKEAA